MEKGAGRDAHSAVLENHGRALTSADKIIIGSNIAVPFISLVPLQKQKWVVK
jgi:hypothetical protein